MADLVKKTKVVPFLNIGTKETPNWAQIKKSTSFTLSMNPQTKTYDFISSDNPQTEITGYQPSLAQSLTMFRDEPDYQEIFKILYNRSTGADAHRDVLIAFYKEKFSYDPDGSGTPEDVFKAWKVDAMVSLNQLDTVNENIDFDLSLNEIEIGAVNLKSGKPEFIAGTFDDHAGTFTKK